MKKLLLAISLCLPSILLGADYNTAVYNTEITGCWSFKDLEIMKINLETGEIVSVMLISSEVANDPNSTIDDFIISNLCVSEEDRNFILTTKSGKAYFGELNDTTSTYMNIMALGMDNKTNYSYNFNLYRSDDQISLIKDFYSEDKKSKSSLRMVLTK